MTISQLSKVFVSMQRWFVRPILSYTDPFMLIIENDVKNCTTLTVIDVTSWITVLWL
jgi:hypothetical protein